MLSDLEMLKKELQDVTSKQIKLETLIEQAKQQCALIEQKYNIKTEEELKQLVASAEKEYMDKIQQATVYLADAKHALLPYEGLL